ncbi:MAG TPA: glutathione S-transferase family protein [Steroidobacteraceae bacterium]|nr:glutathione S-transferase family protein [Steroidobacteraceae bacterium]
MLTLYSTTLSANGRKVLAVGRQLELDIDVRLVNVYRGEGRAPGYLAINPTGKIPTLVDEDLTLVESNAILQYLCEAHGDFRLWSREPKLRGRIARWLFWESAHWQPTLAPLLSPCVGHRLLPNLVPPPAAGPDWDADALSPLMAALGTALSASRFLVGDEITIADFAVAGMVTYFPVARFPFEKYPAFAAWYRRIEMLEAWRATQEPLFTANLPAMSAP